MWVVGRVVLGGFPTCLLLDDTLILCGADMDRLRYFWCRFNVF